MGGDRFKHKRRDSLEIEFLNGTKELGKCMKVYIIGVGPGGEDYILPIARSEIEKTDCLIGAKRLVRLFKNLGKEEVFVEGHFNEVIPYIKRYKDKKRIAVLVSGDPGMYSLLGKLSKVLKPQEYTVIPGISTLQLAFSRIGESWNDAKIISLHGRELDNLINDISSSRKVFLLTDPEFSPNRIAKYLIKQGLDNRRAVVLENLSYPNEKKVDTDLKRLSKMKGFGLSVMVLLAQSLKPYTLRPMPSAKLYGIGIGPGDPKLLTLRAKELLDRINTIFVPKASEDGTSLARAIVESATTSQKNFVEIVFPMTKNRAILNRYWRKASSIIAKQINKGKEAAFVTIGDPSIYSTYVYLLKTMRQNFPNIEIETIPGISAFNAAAASSDFSLVEGNEKMAVVPVTKDLENVRKALLEFDTVVLMKVGSKLDKVVLLLEELGLLKCAVLINRVGHKDERIIRNLSSLRDKRIGYLSVIIVKKGQR